LDRKNQNALKKMLTIMSNIFSWRFVAFFLFVPPKPETFASLGVLQPMSQFLLRQRCGARVLLHATLREAASRGKSMHMEQPVENQS
jgi:hypothetical protein